MLFAVIVQIALCDPGMADDPDVAELLVFQSFLIAGIAEIQPGSFALPANRRFIGQNIEDNHVSGLIIKASQIHIGVPMVFLCACCQSHFLHEFTKPWRLRSIRPHFFSSSL